MLNSIDHFGIKFVLNTSMNKYLLILSSLVFCLNAFGLDFQFNVTPATARAKFSDQLSDRVSDIVTFNNYSLLSDQKITKNGPIRSLVSRSKPRQPDFLEQYEILKRNTLQLYPELFPAGGDRDYVSSYVALQSGYIYLVEKDETYLNKAIKEIKWLPAFEYKSGGLINTIKNIQKASSTLRGLGLSDLLTFDKTIQNRCLAFHLISEGVGRVEKAEFLNKMSNYLELLNDASMAQPLNNHSTRVGAALATCSMLLSLELPLEGLNFDVQNFNRWWTRAHEAMGLGLSIRKKDGVDQEGNTYANYTDEVLNVFIRLAIENFGHYGLVESANFRNYLYFQNLLYNELFGWDIYKDSRKGRFSWAPILLDSRIPDVGIIKTVFKDPKKMFQMVNQNNGFATIEFIIFADPNNRVPQVNPRNIFSDNYYWPDSGLTLFQSKPSSTLIPWRLLSIGTNEHFYSHDKIEGTGDFRIVIGGESTGDTPDYSAGSVDDKSYNAYSMPSYSNSIGGNKIKRTKAYTKNMLQFESSEVASASIESKEKLNIEARYFNWVRNGEYALIFDYKNSLNDPQYIFRFHGTEVYKNNSFQFGESKKELLIYPLKNLIENVTIGRSSPSHHIEKQHFVLERSTSGATSNGTIVTPHADQIQIKKIRSESGDLIKVYSNISSKTDLIFMGSNRDAMFSEFDISHKGYGFFISNIKGGVGGKQLNLYKTSRFSFGSFSIESDREMDLAGFFPLKGKSEILIHTTEMTNVKMCFSELCQHYVIQNELKLNSTKIFLNDVRDLRNRSFQMNYEFQSTNSSLVNELSNLNDQRLQIRLREILSDPIQASRLKTEIVKYSADAIYQVLLDKIVTATGNRFSKESIDYALGTTAWFLAMSTDKPIDVDLNLIFNETHRINSTTTFALVDKKVENFGLSYLSPQIVASYRYSNELKAQGKAGVHSVEQAVDPGVQHSGSLTINAAKDVQLLGGGSLTKYKNEKGEDVKLYTYTGAVKTSKGQVLFRYLSTPDNESYQMALNYLQNLVLFNYIPVTNEKEIKLQNRFMNLSFIDNNNLNQIGLNSSKKISGGIVVSGGLGTSIRKEDNQVGVIAQISARDNNWQASVYQSKSYIADNSKKAETISRVSVTRYDSKNNNNMTVGLSWNNTNNSGDIFTNSQFYNWGLETNYSLNENEFRISGTYSRRKKDYTLMLGTGIQKNEQSNYHLLQANLYGNKGQSLYLTSMVDLSDHHVERVDFGAKFNFGAPPKRK